MMIQLSDGCYVAADQIAEVKVNSNSGTLTVRTKDGIGHSLYPDYGKSVYETADRLIQEINAACSKEI